MKICYIVLNTILAILIIAFTNPGQTFALDEKSTNSIKDMAKQAKGVLQLELLSQGRLSIIPEFGEIIDIKENVKENNIINDYVNINLGQVNGIKEGDILDVFTPASPQQLNDYVIAVGEVKVKSVNSTYSIAVPYINAEEVLHLGYKVRKKPQPFKVVIAPIRTKDASTLADLMEKELVNVVSSSPDLMLIPPKIINNLNKDIKSDSQSGNAYYKVLANKTGADIVIGGSIGYENGNLKGELQVWQPKANGLLAVVTNKEQEKHDEKVLQINPPQPDLAQKVEPSKTETVAKNNDIANRNETQNSPYQLRSVEFQFDVDDLTAGDINLDGKDEIIFAAGSIRIYQVSENSLKLLWKGGVAGKHLVFGRMKDDSMAELYGIYNYYWYKNSLKSFPAFAQGLSPSYYQKNKKNTLLFSSSDQRQIQLYGYENDKYILQNSIDLPFNQPIGVYDFDADGADEFIGIKDGIIQVFNPNSNKKYALPERNDIKAIYTSSDKLFGSYLLAANDKELYSYNAVSSQLEKIWECVYPEENIFSISVGNLTEKAEPKILVGTKKKVNLGYSTKVYFIPLEKIN